MSVKTAIPGGSRSVLRCALLLSVSGMLSKTLDFVFRAYYSQRLGSEGMGILSLIFALHQIMLTAATGGIGVAVSKTVSSWCALRKEHNIRKTMRAAIAAICALSVTVILITVAYSDKIAYYFLKEPRCRQGLVFISPSILFMGVSYCIKGYFYATRKVLRPASSEFLEQAVKIVSITLLLDLWLPHGVSFGVGAVALGLSLGEAASCLYLTVLYFSDSRSIPKKAGHEASGLGGTMFKTAFPIMISSLSGSFFRMQEDVLIVSALRKNGLSHEGALSAYGSLHGMIMPLLVFPLTLLSSFMTLLVPEISRADNLKNSPRLKELVMRIYRFTLLCGFLVMSVYLIFSAEISTAVYNSAEIAPTLSVLSLLMPLMIMDSVSCGILNGLGEQRTLLLCSLTDSVLRIGLIVILVPHFGIKALVLTIIISNLFTALLTVSRTVKRTEIKSNIMAGFWLRNIALAMLAVFAFRSGIFRSEGSGSLLLVIKAAAFASAYLGLGILLLKSVRSDMKWLFKRLFAR